MWRWLLKFCSGSTDLNQNGIPDNEEVLRMIEILAKKLEEIKEQKKSSQ